MKIGLAKIGSKKNCAQPENILYVYALCIEMKYKLFVHIFLFLIIFYVT